MKAREFLPFFSVRSVTPAMAAVLLFVGSAIAQKALGLHRFQLVDGSNPMGNLISDNAGSLYGTTEYGGTSFYGTVFKFAPPAKQGGAWTLTTLYSFTNTGDGARPTNGLVFDNKGNLYGTTSDTDAGGYGEIFQLSPPTTEGGTWTESVLYHFRGGVDGANPLGGLVSDEKGNLYGTTTYTVFELSPPSQMGGAWAFHLLHKFLGGTTDGTQPHDGLVRDQLGNLYGTTLWGGSQPNKWCGPIECGTVFELSPPAAPGGAWTERIIHSFGGGDDGFNPEGGLTLNLNGRLYGTTSSGGTSLAGTVFELAPPVEPGGSWTETVIHNFSSSSTDGASPMATLIQDRGGNLFGTTLFGGNTCYYDFTPYGCGVVFELSPPGMRSGTWNEDIIYSFPTTPGGPKQPWGGVLLDSHGNLFGATTYGGYTNGPCTVDGTVGCGAIYEIVR